MFSIYFVSFIFCYFFISNVQNDFSFLLQKDEVTSGESFVVLFPATNKKWFCDTENHECLVLMYDKLKICKMWLHRHLKIQITELASTAIRNEHVEWTARSCKCFYCNKFSWASLLFSDIEYGCEAFARNNDDEHAYTQLKFYLLFHFVLLRLFWCSQTEKKNSKCSSILFCISLVFLRVLVVIRAIWKFILFTAQMIN